MEMCEDIEAQRSDPLCFKTCVTNCVFQGWWVTLSFVHIAFVFYLLTCLLI